MGNNDEGVKNMIAENSQQIDTSQPVYSELIAAEPNVQTSESGSLDKAENQIEEFYTNEEGIAHSEILEHLLTEIQPVDLRAEVGLPEEQTMREKHYQYAVVKALIGVSQKNKWNMRNLDDYVYVFNGQYWKQHLNKDIRKFLSDAAIKMGMPAYDAKPYTFVDGLMKQFLSDAHFPVPEPDDKKVLINLQNGTFEFTAEGWKQKGFDPNDFMTYQLPFSYDPKAVCPIFDAYLLKVLPDECSQMVLQEYVGYIFTKLNLEKCLVLTGGGANGKSVFFNILNALVGRENALNFSMSLFNQETNRAKLTGVLMNYSSDTGFKLATETFKALVSGEPVQARELYCAPFTLRNKVKFLMNCNTLPRESENTHAYFRRFQIIPFEVTIREAERDIKLAEKIIENELPGVFNWLLVGLERILKNMKFTHCEKGEQALADFKKKADTVMMFIEENNYLPGTNKMLLGMLYEEYVQFCKADGLTPSGKTLFSQELEKKGFTKLPRTNSGIYFAIESKMAE